MKLEISSFADAGNYEDERLILKIISDLDIGEYAVFCSRVSPEKSPISGKKTAFWFPDAAVKAGDLVVLYTKSGKPSTKQLSENRTAHFYYWGLDKAAWGDASNTAVILRVAEWTHRLPEKVGATA
jgi:hypothetical protein